MSECKDEEKMHEREKKMRVREMEKVREGERERPTIRGISSESSEDDQNIVHIQLPHYLICLVLR